MKKLIIILLFTNVLIGSNTGQRTAYYDAIYLNSISKENQNMFKLSAETRPIIEYYFNMIGGKDKELTDAIKTNPFLSNYFSGAGAQSILPGTLIPGLASSIGSMDVTNFADGLAKFLVKRVKTELSTTFFDRFKKDLENNKQLQILFPSTFRALLAIGDQIYNYSAYIDLLRSSFQKDLTLLLPNIKRLVDDKSMNKYFVKFPVIRIIMSDALYIIDEFGQGKFPGEVFHNYVTKEATADSLKKISPNFYPSLMTFDLLSQSLRSTQTDKYWIDKDSLKLLINDEQTLDIYLGLIYQLAVNKKITFNDTISLTSILDTIATNKIKLEPYKLYIAGLIDRGRSIQYYYNGIKKLQNNGDNKPTYQDYFSFFDASVNFLEYVTQLPSMDTLLNAENLQDYFNTVRSAGNIYVDIYEKQYASAIVEFVGASQMLLENELKNKKNVAADDAAKDNLDKLAEDLRSTSDLILKYGSFGASLAKAETSDDVQKAIEAAALPAGSARIKRETLFNVSLNAYTGLFMGHEHIVGVTDKQVINSYGLTAPIGVAVSTGTRKFLGMPCKKDGHWSYSAFVSIIDIGVVAAFRFQNDSVAQVPTIQLKDIFSPGLFFSVGIPKCPLSVNMGAQVGPNLRAVNVYDESTDEYVNKYQNNVYWRFSASIVVDIPIFNFYTKSK